MRMQQQNLVAVDARMRYRLCAAARVRSLERPVYGFGALEGRPAAAPIHPAERSEFRVDRYMNPLSRLSFHTIRSQITSVTSALYVTRGPIYPLR